MEQGVALVDGEAGALQLAFSGVQDGPCSDLRIWFDF